MSTLESHTPTWKAFDAANKHRAACLSALVKDYNEYVAAGAKDDHGSRHQMEISITALCNAQSRWVEAQKGIQP
jgi:hypothetical protein